METILPTTKKILEAYSHIELNEEEFDVAILAAKKKKQFELEQEKLRGFEAENRKLKATRLTFDVIRTYMFNRANKIFKGKFIIDSDNEKFYDLLCYYFIGGEEKFKKLSEEMGTRNPSIQKGLLIPGVYGCGKTWMMQLFSRQTRQCYEIIRAKIIGEEFMASEQKKIPEKYYRPFKNNWDDNDGGSDTLIPNAEVFNQKLLGLCIDDLGSEDIQNKYGNKKNVIGDIIESRYAGGYTGVFLHATSNMTSSELENFYGGRVASRMREIFNWIVLPGEDRRK